MLAELFSISKYWVTIESESLKLPMWTYQQKRSTFAIFLTIILFVKMTPICIYERHNKMLYKNQVFLVHIFLKVLWILYEIVFTYRRFNVLEMWINWMIFTDRCTKRNRTFYSPFLVSCTHTSGFVRENLIIWSYHRVNKQLMQILVVYCELIEGFAPSACN